MAFYIKIFMIYQSKSIKFVPPPVWRGGGGGGGDYVDKGLTVSGFYKGALPKLNASLYPPPLLREIPELPPVIPQFAE